MLVTGLVDPSLLKVALDHFVGKEEHTRYQSNKSKPAKKGPFITHETKHKMLVTGLLVLDF